MTPGRPKRPTCNERVLTDERSDQSSNVWDAHPDLALFGELLAFERKARFAAFFHQQPFAKTPGMRVSASQTVEGR